MKLEIPKSVLLDALQKVQNVVSLRSTLPILSNVLIQADKNSVALTTTDLEVCVRCHAEANVIKSGASTIPVRRLSSIIRELPEGTIELETDEKNIATLTCGSSFFKIIGLSEDEFPPIPKAEGSFACTLDQGQFKNMLRKTSYAASSDETRYVLNGVLLSIKGGKFTVVATDGRRLALVEQEVEIAADTQAEMILPSKAVNELMHVLKDEGELKVTGSDKNIVFEFNSTTVASKLIEGTYPNYRQVIPGQHQERVAIEREGLLTALRRVSLVTNDKSNAAKLIFGKNKLSVIMATVDIGEARETLPIKYTGKEITVAFNPDYMMDPLKCIDSDEVYVEFTDELSPGVIKCDTPFLYVLMPMRVS